MKTYYENTDDIHTYALDCNVVDDARHDDNQLLDGEGGV